MRGQPKPRHYTCIDTILPPSKKETHTTQGQPSRKHTSCCARHPQPRHVFRGRLRACRLHAHLAGMHPTPNLADRTAICLSKSTLARSLRGCTPQASLCLATYGILEESRVASRRSLLVFRRGVRDAASTNARPGSEQACCCVQSIAHGLFGGITFRSLDEGCYSLRGSKAYSAASTTLLAS